jgi:hypothetical protein
MYLLAVITLLGCEFNARHSHRDNLDNDALRLHNGSRLRMRGQDTSGGSAIE